MAGDTHLSSGYIVDSDGEVVGGSEFRSDSAAGWSSANPVLRAGEPAYVTDSGVFVVGDGVNTFTDLSGEGLAIVDQASTTTPEQFGSTNNLTTAKPIANTTIVVPDLTRTVWLRGECPLASQIEPDAIKQLILAVGPVGETTTAAMLRQAYFTVGSVDSATSTGYVEYWLPPGSAGSYQLYASIVSLASVDLRTVTSAAAPAMLTALSVS